MNSPASAINKLLTIRNWLIGFYIAEYEQKGEDRAKYGEKLLLKLSGKLNQKDGFPFRNLKLFRQFYNSYPQFYAVIKELLVQDASIGQSLIAQSLNPKQYLPPDKLIDQLAYTHFIQLLSIEDSVKRIFYELECIKDHAKAHTYSGFFIKAKHSL